MFVFIFLYTAILIIFCIYLLYPWKKIKQFVFLNVLLFVSYTIPIIYLDEYIWGEDLFGLGKLFRLFLVIIIHVTLLFIFSLVKNPQLRNEKSN
ncbi:conserved membrane hypothetical protein [Tenacibaculum crassostreae]